MEKLKDNYCTEIQKIIKAGAERERGFARDTHFNKNYTSCIAKIVCEREFRNSMSSLFIDQRFVSIYVIKLLNQSYFFSKNKFSLVDRTS